MDLLPNSTAMGVYLTELSTLLGRRVDSSDLSTVQETKEFHLKSKSLDLRPSSSFVIPFTEKSSPRFRQFIKNLCSRRDTSAVIFTPLTMRCGFIKIQSLTDINFDFPFNLNGDGIVSIALHDLSNRIVLDFYIVDSGEKSLQVEIEGADWQVAY